MNQPDFNLSIVIPAYNEAGRISRTLEALKEYIEKKSFTVEVIVVDDGSSDETAILVEKFTSNFKNLRILSYPFNQGKGFAVKFGFANAQGKVVLMADADGATPFEELDKLLPWIDEGFDIVVGSRAIKSNDIILKTLPHRKILGRVFSFFVYLVLELDIKDTQCGFKLFKRERCKVLFDKQQIKGFGFDAELLYLGKIHRLSMKEVPISWHEVKGSKVNLLKDPLKMFLDLLTIRYNQIRGTYR